MYSQNARMRDMENPDRMTVGRRRCVRERTMSRNSCDEGTGGISFHWVCVLVGGIVGVVLTLKQPMCVMEGVNDGTFPGKGHRQKKN